MKVTTTTTRRTTHTLHLDDDTELEILFEPIDNTIVVKYTGDDKIKVGYLVQDDGHGSNPMEDHDGNGKLLYDREMDQSAFGFDGYGLPDIWREFNVGSDTVTLWQLAKDANPTTDEPEVMDIAYDLYPKYFEHICRWVVPIEYHDYGSGGTVFRISDWAGETRHRLPNAVWIADKDARANLEFEGKVPTRAEVEEYAKGVIEEYEKWCNGEVYGVVVETFECGPPEYGHDELSRWRKTDGHDNECWGHIGYDYAKETLKESMQ